MMRTSVLWKISGITLIASVVILACQKQQHTTGAGVTTTVAPHATRTPFNIYVGGPIDTATAHRYTRHMAERRSSSKLLAGLPTSFYLPAAVLKNLIGMEEAVGICFYYGQDSNGKVAIVPVAVNENGYVLVAEKVTTTQGTVSWQQAKDWRLNFQANHASGTWGHFSGSLVLNQLLAEGSELVRLEPAINDEGAQTLVTSNGDVVDPSLEYDRNFSCPPTCSLEGQ